MRLYDANSRFDFIFVKALLLLTHRPPRWRPMPAYRLYFPGGDGHIAAVEAFEREDDVAAIERAQ